MVTLPGATAARYRRFSLYNSPYPAHDRGRAVDLYPGAGNGAPSPVPGVVRETRTVSAPARPYAVDRDHLVVVDVDDGWTAANAPGRDGLLARVLHVDPRVERGDRVEAGESLGRMVRSGFFGRWVANHLHLGFRPAGADPRRASGSLPLSVGVDVEAVPWDGTGTVVETGPTHARLDAPAHPAPGERFAAVGSDGGVPLDGGLVHYAGGGALAPADGPLSLLGTPVADAPTGDGESPAADRREAASADASRGASERTLRWRDVAVRANGSRATGLSLFAARRQFGAKLVFHEGHDFAVGDEVSVSLAPVADPVRLG
jgi:hypothetical protein